MWPGASPGIFEVSLSDVFGEGNVLQFAKGAAAAPSEPKTGKLQHAAGEIPKLVQKLLYLKASIFILLFLLNFLKLFSYALLLMSSGSRLKWCRCRTS